MTSEAIQHGGETQRKDETPMDIFRNTNPPGGRAGDMLIFYTGQSNKDPTRAQRTKSKETSPRGGKATEALSAGSWVPPPNPTFVEVGHA